MTIGEGTRTRVLDAAEALFATDGIRATPIDAVIARAGVSSATLYRAYRTKEQLVAAALLRRHERWIATWDAAIAEADGPEGRLLAVFDAFDAMVREHEGRWCAFLGAAAEYREGDDGIGEAVALDTDTLRARLRALAAEVAPDAADALAEQLLLIASGALAMRLRQPGGDAAVARTIARSCVAEARSLA